MRHTVSRVGRPEFKMVLEENEMAPGKTGVAPGDKMLSTSMVARLMSGVAPVAGVLAG